MKCQICGNEVDLHQFKTLAERVNFLRKSRSLSISELANKSGVSRGSIHKLARSGRTVSAINVVLLAQFFGVTTDFLLMGVTDNGNGSE